MLQDQKSDSPASVIAMLLMLINIALLKTAFINNSTAFIFLLPTLPLLFLAIHQVKRRQAVVRSHKQTIKI